MYWTKHTNVCVNVSDICLCVFEIVVVSHRARHVPPLRTKGFLLNFKVSYIMQSWFGPFLVVGEQYSFEIWSATIEYLYFGQFSHIN